MAVWPRDKIRSALTSKGFELREDGDHELLTFKVDGLTRAIFTKLSRGKNYRVYGNPRLSDMSHQLKVTRKQLDRLIECSMDLPEYTACLRSQGIIR